MINQISKWLRPQVKVYNTFNEMEISLYDFFRGKRGIEEKGQVNNRTTSTTTSFNSIFVDFDRAREKLESAKSFFTIGKRSHSTLKEEESPSQLKEEKIMERVCSLSMVGVRGDDDDDNTDSRVESSSSLVKALAFNSIIKKPPSNQLESSNDIDDQGGKVDMRHQARNYLEQVKALLSKDGIKIFSITLQQYRAKQIDIGKLLKIILELYDQEGTRELLVGLRTFISSRHQDLYDKMVREYTNPMMIIGEGELLPPKRALVTTTGGEGSHHQTAMTAATTPICSICKDPANNGYSAKCGHVACFTCWTSWLQVKLECPICKMRTRIPQLGKK